MDTPDTLNYLIIGYVVFTIVFFGYLASIVIRWRNLKQEKETLEELKK